MKKVLFTAALLLGAFTASAQLSVVKEAKAKKGNPAEAAKILESALTNPETANDPNTWQLAGDFQKAIYDAENEINYLVQAGVEKNKTANMEALHSSLLKMFEYYMKCDDVEQAQVAAGALKKAKLRKKNADALLQRRPNLANGGVAAFDTNDYASVQNFFGMYVDVVAHPMFADKEAELKADTLWSLYANYAAMGAALRTPKDAAAVVKYGTIGKENKNEGWRSLMFMAEVYGDKENGDSIKWLETVKEGAEKFPEQDFFVGNVMDYYLQKGLVEEGLAQIDNMLTVNEKPFLLYVKGVLLYEKKDYEAAKAVLAKVAEGGSDMAAEASAKQGDCYFVVAQQLIEENNSLALEDPKYNENNAKIKEIFEQAKPYYEKARQLEPNNTTIWGRQLSSIYWVLNQAEYEILVKELGY